MDEKDLEEIKVREPRRAISGTSIGLDTFIPLTVAERDALIREAEQAATLQRRGEEMAMALKATQPRLQDWMRTTGFGDIYWKDREALEMVTSALTAWQKARGGE